MKLSPSYFLLCATLLPANVLLAQTPTPLSAIEEPNSADFEMVVEESPPLFAPVAALAPEPMPPTQRVGATSEQYRLVAENLREKKHQFIHCKLKNGKILTGLPRDVGAAGFSLHTDIFAETFVRYDDLAEAPKPVAAVGTRIKQGAEWTGLVAFIVVFFIPLALTGAIPDC